MIEFLQGAKGEHDGSDGIIREGVVLARTEGGKGLVRRIFVEGREQFWQGYREPG